MSAALVTLAVPCRTDEPALARTLDAALASWRRAPQAGRAGLEVLVCLNGADARGPRAALAAFAAAAGAPFEERPVDAARPEGPPPPVGAISVTALVTARTGKPLAWNALRAAARAPLALFLDADVAFAPDVFGRLLDALEAHPEAALATARTTCAPRPGWFEAIMAAPYGVFFPNISPQLYGARLALLPPAIPDDLLEPERWLELRVGRDRVVRAEGAEVVVRLPGTLADFFRQRIRIEMGKVQFDHEYPGLTARGQPQPGLRAVLASLDGRARARLSAYLALRTAAHAVAWWRYRRGRTAGIWRQAATTKRWDGA